MKLDKIAIQGDFIKLDQFLKWVSLVSSGTEAKFLISEGKVLVNEEIETRRGRKIVPGDQIKFGDQIFIISEKDGISTKIHR